MSITLGSIFYQVERGIQDPSFERERDILPLVNECISEVSQLFCLPALQVNTSIIAETESIEAGHLPLPENYHHDLYRVFNATNRKEVSIRGSLKALEGLYDDMPKGGYIKDVAVVNDRLWVKPLPLMVQHIAEQELALFYYRKPALFEDHMDDYLAVDGLPEHLVPVVVDFVLWRLFLLVEDGLQGQPVNSARYAERYNMGLLKVKEYCKNSPKMSPVVARRSMFF